MELKNRIQIFTNENRFKCVDVLTNDFVFHVPNNKPSRSFYIFGRGNTLIEQLKIKHNHSNSSIRKVKRYYRIRGDVDLF